MMIKIDSEFIVLQNDPEMVKQAKTPDIVDSAGDFSYQFDIQNTTEYRNIIGLKSLYTEQFNVDAQLVTDDGVPLYIGILNIEGIERNVIHCSFIAGNSDWFTVLKDKKVYDVPINYVDQWKIIEIDVSPSADLVAAWDRTDGVVFPLIDMGFQRLYSVQSLTSSDFMPWAFVRNIMQAIFQSNGFNYEGDLFSDGLYNNLITGVVNPRSGSLPYFEGLQIFVGKSSSQSINTVDSVITFTDTSYPFYVGSFNNWSVNTYTVSLPFTAYWTVDFSFSTSVTYTVTVYVNGVLRSTIEGTGTEVSKKVPVNLNQGDTVQVKTKIASGTANILTGSSLKVDVLRFRYYYPTFLVGNMTQGDFIKSVFTMFNVISSYNARTKTVTCSLFEKLTDKETIDLSEHISDYRIDTIEVLQDLSAKMIFKHQEGVTDEVHQYNKTTEVPFGGGIIEPMNRLLTDVKEIETQFTAGMDHYSNLLRASVIDTGAISVSIDDSSNKIASVSDDGSGIAVFHTVDIDNNPIAHGLNTLDYVNISSSSTGDYIGVGRVIVGAVNGLADDEFKIQRLSYVSTATANYQRTSVSVSDDSDHAYIAVYVPRGPVTNFSHLTQIKYNTTFYSDLPWAYFLKQSYDVPYDRLRLSPSFGTVDNNFSIPLLDSYYSLYRRSIMNPVKVVATMTLPENVYLNIRFDQAVELKTEDFTGLFFIQRITGYVGSHKECQIDFIKLS